MQDIREYELDYEAAKKAAAAVAIEAEKEEERRIKMLEKNPLGELPGFEEEEDFNFGTTLAGLSLWVNGILDHAASIIGCRNAGMRLHPCCLLGSQCKNRQNSLPIPFHLVEDITAVKNTLPQHTV